MRINILSFITVLGMSLIIFLSACSTNQSDSNSEKPGIDREAVRSKIKEHISEFKNCYDIEYNKDHSLEGKVVLRFRFTTTGKVIEQSIVDEKTTLKNAALHQCMLDTIGDIVFPNAPDGRLAEVTYPFLFQGTKP
jgi:hypothetical protein